VEQLGEATLLRTSEEAVEGAQHHIFLVGRTAGCALEKLPCQPDQAADIALPEILEGRLFAGLEPANPVGDRAGTGHGCSPRGRLRLVEMHPECKAGGQGLQGVATPATERAVPLASDGRVERKIGTS